MGKNDISSLKDIFKTVDALNPDAAILDSSTLSTATDWIDTGSLALNAIISGSLYKGIPAGRITGFSGPSQAGKTLIMNKIMANAQKKGYIAVIWDSEVAVDKKSAEAAGMLPDRTKYYPVETIEDCRNQICTFLDNVIKTDDPELKFIVAIDSLGNLASAKEIRDTANAKDSSDVGQRAKAIKSMMRVLTYKAAKARVPILFSNHIYDSMEMFPTLVKTQSGGKGPIYLASVLVQLSTKNEKVTENPEEESIAIAHNISGVTLGALTVKNRFIPSYLKTELYLNFRTGLDKHAGLFDIATAFKVLNQEGRTFTYKGKSLGFRKNIEKNTEVWEKIMPDLEKALQENLTYSSHSKTVEIEEEVANIDS
jgi:RecA/RadA recombinase